jgi:hypothetical protein
MRVQYNEPTCATCMSRANAVTRLICVVQHTQTQTHTLKSKYIYWLASRPELQRTPLSTHAAAGARRHRPAARAAYRRMFHVQICNESGA